MDGLRSYAFVSVFVAHAADGELAPPEMATVRENVHRVGSHLGHSQAQTEGLLRQAIDEYWETLADEGPAAVLKRYRKEVQELGRCFGPDPSTLRAIQRDLAAIAQADGTFADMERFLIDGVGRTWEREQA